MMTSNTSFILTGIVAILFGALEPGSAHGAPLNISNFQSFWSAFRYAALHQDIAAVETLTRFPLYVGFEDREFTRHVTRSQFPRFFRAAMQCSGVSSTQTQLFEKTVTPGSPATDASSAGPHEGLANVGSFEFVLKMDRWKFAGVNYGDVEEYNARLRGACSH